MFTGRSCRAQSVAPTRRIPRFYRRLSRRHGCRRLQQQLQRFLFSFFFSFFAAADLFFPFAEEQLIGICFDFLVAGSETTSHTLGFAMVLMITHPDVQSRVQTEIDNVLLGRLPCLADRGRYRANNSCSFFYFLSLLMELFLFN